MHCAHSADTRPAAIFIHNGAPQALVGCHEIVFRKLILDSYLSKGRRPASLEWCKIQELCTEKPH